MSLLRNPIYLFGAGGAASWVLSGFKRESLVVAGFLDDAADQIKHVCGLPVYNPTTNRISESEKQNSSVVFCVMNRKIDESAILQKLRKMGWKNCYAFSEFGKKLFRETGIRCGMLDHRSLISNMDKITFVRSILSDEKSRSVFDGFIDFCLTLDEKVSIDSSQYFPKDIPRWKDNLRLIDCGGYCGSVMMDAIENKYSLVDCISFEPDLINFQKLSQTIRSMDGVIACPCAVSDKTQLIKFRMQGDMGSFMDDDGDLMIQSVSIDEMLPTFAPNLIKMDIEGSEQKALRGARKTLEKYKPCLAISIYHMSDDLFEIPLYINQIYGCEYDYYMRKHSRTIADTILYVCPKNKSFDGGKVIE
jgi:FkbM family methyltransferase